ncbi:serine hydrolase domain-containing protein [Sphingomonas alpina]|uniref:Beta-lactamase family protein n=1 Tax=Sphingomonas alpina TaxID=653931 RepID=A0A7H0LMC1_9SPHN|nr:serine hydrolase domain-containing protein [Sphingomonas alpina]QNQ10824.1 beta-lactamase family protein [Sphingomonas alpina]
MSRRGLLGTALAGYGLAAFEALAAGWPPSAALSDAAAQAIKPAGIAALALVAMAGGRVIDTLLLGQASQAFGVPVTDRTLFHLGSVGKHITAVAILRLAAQGKLALDAPLSRYVQGIAPGWSRATIYQLLTHTGGLPGNFDGQDFDRPFTREKVSAFSAALTPVAAPGQAWVYSNVGYVLLGHVIENLTGDDYGRHITDTLFRPHGLIDSRADDGEGIIPNRAEPLIRRDGAFRRAMQMSSSVSSVGAGGLLMSARDVPAWERALGGRALLDQRSKEIMFTAARFDTGRSTSYGMGWRIESDGAGRPFFMHTGSVPGFRAYHFRAPAGDLALMLMAVGEAPMVPFGMAATERQWPGRTPLARPAIPDRAPGLTAALKALVVDGKPVDAASLAPELARLPLPVATDEIARLNPEQRARLKQFSLVEDVVTIADRQRRYILDLGAQRLPLLACYSPEGSIYRVVI